jgi:hypothetical protein
MTPPSRINCNCTPGIVAHCFYFARFPPRIFECTHTHKSREDLIVKTLSDIPAFDRIKAETEVDKFLMDFEMMNLYIQYGKEIEKDPDFVVPDSNDEEGIFSFRTVVILYLAYVAFTSIPDLVRRYIAEQQIDGTWQPTNIPFVDNWIDETSADAIARVLSKTVEAAAATADAVVDTAVDLGNAAASTTVPVSSAALLDSIAAASSSIFTDPTVAAVMDAVQAGVQ